MKQIKPRKIKVTVSCEVETSFYSLGNKKSDNAFKRQIKNWIEGVVKDHCTYIPHYEDAQEHVTQESKIWVFLDD